jgi:hypothetical protein
MLAWLKTAGGLMKQLNTAFALVLFSLISVPAFAEFDYCAKLKAQTSDPFGSTLLFEAKIRGVVVPIQIIPLNKTVRSDLDAIKKVGQEICVEGNTLTNGNSLIVYAYDSKLSEAHISGDF